MLKERYEARCQEIFRNLTTGNERVNPDEQTTPVSVHDYAECYRSSKYDLYDLSEVDASGAGLTSTQAVDNVLDFISGLK